MQYIQGVTSIGLVRGCELDVYDNTLQPAATVVPGCPGVDYMRIWPLPVVRPWEEEWWKKPMPPGEHAVIREEVKAP